jgi:hypothetical protein
MKRYNLLVLRVTHNIESGSLTVEVPDDLDPDTLNDWKLDDPDAAKFWEVMEQSVEWADHQPEWIPNGPEVSFEMNQYKETEMLPSLVIVRDDTGKLTPYKPVVQ